MEEFLDQQATQTLFASIVGVTQQAISKQVKEGVLKPGASLRTWLVDYCEHLREEAAGRGGEDQKNLTKARTMDALASAELRQLQIKEKAGELVPVAEIEPLLMAMVTAARTELLALPDKLAAELKALTGAEVDASLIEERIHDALNHLGTSLQDLAAGDDDAGGESVVAASEINDNAMG